jgi:DNA-binding GntR family transcriptional regulator
MTDWVIDELRSAIIELRLPPGEPLREAAIAESLGLSKTPVREALSRLEHEGLVELTSFKGAVVSTYTRRDLIEMYELRELIETWVVRRAAQNMGEDDRARLRALMERSNVLSTSGRTPALEKAVEEFDTLLYEQVTNIRIAALVDNMRSHLTRIGRLTTRIPGRLQKSVTEHMKIADALLLGDADKAEAALRVHIESLRKDQLEAMRGDEYR